MKLNFGWTLKSYMQKGLLKFVDLYSLWAAELPDLTKPLDVKQLMATINRAEEGVSGGRETFDNFSPFFNFLESEQTVLRMAYVIKAKAKKTGTTLLCLMDEGAQSKQAEEHMKSICDYVLTTDIHGKERRIRVAKALTKHGLEWHGLLLTDKGVDVEIVL